MRNAFLIGLFGIAATAAAEEWFVPRATHIRIANRSGNAITIDVGGRPVVLGPRATHETSGSVRVASHAAPDITAVHQTELATVTVPVLGEADALDAGFLPQAQIAGWESVVGVVNPHDTDVLVTISGTSFAVAANGMRYLDVDGRSFTATRPVLAFLEETNGRSGARLITKARPFATSSRRRAVRVGPGPTPEPQKHTVTLIPSKDATLYEIGSGSLANGAGIHLFAGLTSSNLRRRALVHFDPASQIPAGSKVASVTLTMSVSMTISGASPFRLHPVTTDWTEGTSNAGNSRDGGGTSARTGDATWIHSSFDTRRWGSAGGDFNATPDATTSFGSGAGTWGPAASLTARVQSWVDQPASNFGWIVIGNEAQPRSAKRFDSREIGEDTKPRLVVEFTR